MMVCGGPVLLFNGRTRRRRVLQSGDAMALKITSFYLRQGKQLEKKIDEIARSNVVVLPLLVKKCTSANERA